MKQKEWLACEKPRRMLEFLRTRSTQRKFRLFVCVSVRRDTSTRSKKAWQAVELAERWVDGLATDAEVERFRRKHGEAWATLAHDPYQAALGAAESDHVPPQEELAGLIRDIFGNPFRKVAIESTWLTTTVTDLAKSAYEERSLPDGGLPTDRLGILADALQDAGCDNKLILNHCRGSGPHVRGCWVLDLLLGKE